MKVGIGSYGDVEVVLEGADVDASTAVESDDGAVVNIVAGVETRSTEEDAVELKEGAVEAADPVVEIDSVEERDSIVEEVGMDDVVREAADDVSGRMQRQLRY